MLYDDSSFDSHCTYARSSPIGLENPVYKQPKSMDVIGLNEWLDTYQLSDGKVWRSCSWEAMEVAMIQNFYINLGNLPSITYNLCVSRRKLLTSFTHS